MVGLGDLRTPGLAAQILTPPAPSFWGTWVWGQFNVLGAPPTPKHPQLPFSPSEKARDGTYSLGVTRGRRVETHELGVLGGEGARSRLPHALGAPVQTLKRANVSADRFPSSPGSGLLWRRKNTGKVSTRACFGFSSVCLPIKKWPARRQLCGFHSVKRIRGKAPALLDFRLRFATPWGRRDPAAPARASFPIGD